MYQKKGLNLATKTKIIVMGSGYVGMLLDVQSAQQNDISQKVFSRDIFGGN